MADYLTFPKRDYEAKIIHPASFNDVEHYRAQMRSLFGSADLPAIIYKGEPIPARRL